MSCYRPLISRWRRHDHVHDTRPGHVINKVSVEQDSSSEDHVLNIIQRKGVSGLTLSSDYNDMSHPPGPHFGHDQHDTRAPQQHPRGVLSLGLPLGISSLKIGSRRRKKHKKQREAGLMSGYQSDGGTRGWRTHDPRAGDWYQTLNKSSLTINDEDDLMEYHHHRSTAASLQNANIAVTKRPVRHAERKSSLPRLSAGLIRSNFDELQQRPRSVDADLLIESIHSPPSDALSRLTGNSIDTCRVTGSETCDDMLKYAGLTSPKQFMLTRDKSSSGNSSASDVTADTDTDTRDVQRCQHPVLRGRGHAGHVAAPTHHRPPRHLLPAKLKPSPGVKCHPYVMLPPHNHHHPQQGIITLKYFLNPKYFLLIHHSYNDTWSHGDQSLLVNNTELEHSYSTSLTFSWDTDKQTQTLDMVEQNIWFWLLFSWVATIETESLLFISMIILIDSSRSSSPGWCLNCWL